MEKGRPWVAGVGLLLGVVMAAAATMITQEPGDRRGAGEQPPAVQDRLAQESSKRQLRRQLRALAEMDRDPASALNASQAEQLLALLKPWTTKSRMTEGHARVISRSVEKLLTPEQIKAIAQLQAQRDRRFNGPGGPGAGRGGFPAPGYPDGFRAPGYPGGPRPPGYPDGPRSPGGPYGLRPSGVPDGPRPPDGAGGPPRFDLARMNAMRNENVLSTVENPDMPWTGRRVQANKRLFALLEARARSKAPDTRL